MTLETHLASNLDIVVLFTYRADITATMDVLQTHAFPGYNGVVENIARVARSMGGRSFCAEPYLQAPRHLHAQKVLQQVERLEEHEDTSHASAVFKQMVRKEAAELVAHGIAAYDEAKSEMDFSMPKIVAKTQCPEDE